MIEVSELRSHRVRSSSLTSSHRPDVLTQPTPRSGTSSLHLHCNLSHSRRFLDPLPESITVFMKLIFGKHPGIVSSLYSSFTPSLARPPPFPTAPQGCFFLLDVSRPRLGSIHRAPQWPASRTLFGISRPARKKPRVPRGGLLLTFRFGHSAVSFAKGATEYLWSCHCPRWASQRRTLFRLSLGFIKRLKQPGQEKKKNQSKNFKAYGRKYYLYPCLFFLCLFLSALHKSFSAIPIVPVLSIKRASAYSMYGDA